MVIGSFVLFLLAFVLIGAPATLKSDRTSTDYLVANRTVRPWLVGLSAMATNNSGGPVYWGHWVYVCQWIGVSLGHVRVDGR
ncbi:MAG: hypothetical protein Ct9H300mP25_12010 [Acidobacteriota bacterium]|nr:MAG: hypothetical protein Ct9H300mP25_12010 [Acidobacteriota bacterium]